MTRRLAIIGTSHVSALALAWQDMASDWTDLSVTFFAAPGWNFRRLELDADKRFGILDESRFEPAEIQILSDTFGRTHLHLGEFDAVLHVGRDIRETDLVSILANFSIDALRPRNEARPMSGTTYARFAAALAEQAVLPPEWHHWDKPALFVLPAPRYSESCVGATGPIYADWAALLDQHAAGLPFATQLDDYCAQVRTGFADAGISMVLPPDSVRAKNGLTLERFTKEARQLNNAVYSQVDHKHMNAAYGHTVLTLVLRQIAPRIGLSVPAGPSRA